MASDYSIGQRSSKGSGTPALITNSYSPICEGFLEERVLRPFYSQPTQRGG